MTWGSLVFTDWQLEVLEPSNYGLYLRKLHLSNSQQELSSGKPELNLKNNEKYRVSAYRPVGSNLRTSLTSY